MITDKIDGDIARARNLVTNFGKIADPIADKAITGMAFIGALDRRRHLVVGDHPGAAPRVERDPAAALGPQARRDRRGRQRQGQDRRSRRWPWPVLSLPLRARLGHGGASTSSGLGACCSTSARSLLAGAVAMTMWSGYEFFRDVWRQRDQLRGAA